MKISEYAAFDGLALAALVRRREVSRTELAAAALNAIAALNPQLNAVIETWPEEAARLDDEVPDGPFAGVPFLLKDIGSHDAGVTFEMGTRLAAGLKAPPEASELMRRFRASGVTVLGRTNVPELGASCSTEPVLHGPTRNPWDLTRSPGGSSGGAAAAVASAMVPIAHANDAGGSIRVPASACGLFGLKPSRNLNPVGPDAGLALYGLAAEHIVSRSVRDSAAMLDATAGPDPGAWCWTPRHEGSYLQSLHASPGRLRVGLCMEAVFPPTPLADEVVAATHDAAALCESLGHHVETAALAFDHEAVFDAFATLWCCGLRGAIEFLSQLTGRQPGEDTLEPHLLAAWRDGAAVPATRALAAIDAMNVVARAYGRLFQRFDVLLTPVLSEPPFALGRVPALPAGTFHEWCTAMSRLSPFTATANLAGVPAMSVPLGRSQGGLPIGAHFVAPMGAELRLLQLAAQLEQIAPWAGRVPATHALHLG